VVGEGDMEKSDDKGEGEEPLLLLLLAIFCDVCDGKTYSVTVACLYVCSLFCCSTLTSSAMATVFSGSVTEIMILRLMLYHRL
jgi:hypothetical protein